MVWSTTPLFKLAKRAMTRDSAICVAHSHPTTDATFSERDDLADKESFEIVFGRMETDRPHFSLVMDRAGEFSVRAFGPDLVPKSAGLTVLLGAGFACDIRDAAAVGRPPRLTVRFGFLGGSWSKTCRNCESVSLDAVERAPQSLAFLRESASLVSCSLIVIVLTRRNLNRLHFSTQADAVLGRYKVDVVGQAIAQIGLARSVVRIPHFADAPSSREALCACDVIFGCTDDHLGRHLLNRLAYFYLIPVIDLGVLIEPTAVGYDTFDGTRAVGSTWDTVPKLSETDQFAANAGRGNAELRSRDTSHGRAGYSSGSDQRPIVVTFTTRLPPLP